jgi:hypothetical protein
VPSYPSGMTVSNRALIMLADLLRQNRAELKTRWRRLDAGPQALLVVAHLRKGETYADPGDRLRYRHRNGLPLPARGTGPARRHSTDLGPNDRHRPRQGLRHPRRHPATHRPRRHDRRSRPALLRRKAHATGLNVQVIANPAGRGVWASPALPGSRHDIAAAREHGILDALGAAEIIAVADIGYQGAGPAVRVPQRRAGSIPAPAGTGGCRTTRRPSTPRTPASADPASANAGLKAPTGRRRRPRRRRG